MSLRERLELDLKQALRDRDETRRDTLRMVLSEVKRAEIDEDRSLADSDVLAVVQRAVKTRRESIEQFERGGREDLARREREQIAVLEGYLPRALGEDEVVAAVEAAIAEVGAQSKRDLGKVMKAVLGRHPGRVDGKLVQRLAAERLA